MNLIKKILNILLLVTISSATFAQKIDFSGKFKVNKAKTNFEQAPEFILPRYIAVIQNDNQIIISRTHLDQQLVEQKPVTDTLRFDNRPVTRIYSQNAKATILLNWIDSRSFSIVITAPSQMIKEVWTLDDNGKTLHIERSVTQGKDFNYQTHAFFDRE